mmetsp:Transcript_3471/g.7400  ORF Transcript_3471/g.7400 Transcript_3471/m.7400 type:complete len:255 (-) Transcript_3471:304-1068(-)
MARPAGGRRCRRCCGAATTCSSPTRTLRGSETRGHTFAPSSRRTRLSTSCSPPTEHSMTTRARLSRCRLTASRATRGAARTSTSSMRMQARSRSTSARSTCAAARTRRFARCSKPGLSLSSTTPGASHCRSWRTGTRSRSTSSCCSSTSPSIGPTITSRAYSTGVWQWACCRCSSSQRRSPTSSTRRGASSCACSPTRSTRSSRTARTAHESSSSSAKRSFGMTTRRTTETRARAISRSSSRGRSDCARRAVTS